MRAEGGAGGREGRAGRAGASPHSSGLGVSPASSPHLAPCLSHAQLLHQPRSLPGPRHRGSQVDQLLVSGRCVGWWCMHGLCGARRSALLCPRCPLVPSSSQGVCGGASGGRHPLCPRVLCCVPGGRAGGLGEAGAPARTRDCARARAPVGQSACLRVGTQPPVQPPCTVGPPASQPWEAKIVRADKSGKLVVEDEEPQEMKISA